MSFVGWRGKECRCIYMLGILVVAIGDNGIEPGDRPPFYSRAPRRRNFLSHNLDPPPKLWRKTDKESLRGRRTQKKRPGWVFPAGPFRITGRVKSPLMDSRLQIAGKFLEVNPELGIAPVLVSRAKTILRQVITREKVAVAHLPSHLIVLEEQGVDHVDFPSE